MVRKIAFIGAQTGDEGKGVREAYYAKEAVEHLRQIYGDSREPRVWTMRWHGGSNAGHTVEIDNCRYALHQIPSGILVAGTYNLMGEGVFLEPRRCLKEIAGLVSKGVKIDKDNFGIASNAHVTLDYHLDEDLKDLKKENHTSTGNGIKQTAVDKYGRVGIRFEEFLDRDAFVDALKRRFSDGMPEKFVSYERFADSYVSEREALAEFSVLQSNVFKKDNFKIGIGEGAQGFILDIDRGLYPGITSSNPSVVPFRADKIVGVVKMYESSIGGDRPFVGRMEPGIETTLRQVWREFGTTTGKPRNIGWLDLVALKHAVESSDVDCLVSTCGDRIEELAKSGERVKLIVGYKIGDKIFTEWDKSFHKRDTLYNAKPVFEEFAVWQKFLDSENKKLTLNAQKFVDRVEELTGKKFIAHGYGPGIDDVFEVENIFTE